MALSALVAGQLMAPWPGQGQPLLSVSDTVVPGTLSKMAPGTFGVGPVSDTVLRANQENPGTRRQIHAGLEEGPTPAAGLEQVWEAVQAALREGTAVESESGIRIGLGTPGTPEYAALQGGSYWAAALYAYHYGLHVIRQWRAKPPGDRNPTPIVFLAMDSRTSNAVNRGAVVRGLLVAASEENVELGIRDLGIYPKPMALLAARDGKADGTFLLTASHNPKGPTQQNPKAAEDFGMELTTGMKEPEGSPIEGGALLAKEQFVEIRRQVTALRNDKTQFEAWSAQVGQVSREAVTEVFGKSKRQARQERGLAIYVQFLKEAAGLTDPEKLREFQAGVQALLEKAQAQGYQALMVYDENLSAARRWYVRAWEEIFGTPGAVLVINNDLALGPAHDPQPDKNIEYARKKALDNNLAYLFAWLTDDDADRGYAVFREEVRPQGFSALLIHKMLQDLSGPTTLVLHSAYAPWFGDIAAAHNARVIMTDVGESTVVRRAQEEEASGRRTVKGEPYSEAVIPLVCRDGGLGAVLLMIAAVGNPDVPLADQANALTAGWVYDVDEPLVEIPGGGWDNEAFITRVEAAVKTGVAAQQPGFEYLVVYPNGAEDPVVKKSDEAPGAKYPKDSRGAVSFEVRDSQGRLLAKLWVGISSTNVPVDERFPRGARTIRMFVSVRKSEEDHPFLPIFRALPGALSASLEEGLRRVLEGLEANDPEALAVIEAWRAEGPGQLRALAGLIGQRVAKQGIGVIITGNALRQLWSRAATEGGYVQQLLEVLKAASLTVLADDAKDGDRLWDRLKAYGVGYDRIVVIAPEGDWVAALQSAAEQLVQNGARTIRVFATSADPVRPLVVNDFSIEIALVQTVADFLAPLGITGGLERLFAAGMEETAWAA